MLSGRIGSAFLTDGGGVVGGFFGGGLFGGGRKGSRGAPEGTALGGGRKRRVKLGGVNSLKRRLGERYWMKGVVSVDVVHGVRKNAHRLPRVVGGRVAKPTNEVLIATKLVGGKARNETAVNDAVDDELTVGQRAVTTRGDERIRHKAGNVERVVETA